ncbi:MAG: undecaprenyl-diphosphate phosphatase [Bacteroidaceae bacterium]|nr:undecaprenyl-diphosphate phosphatase [Bacteroidaceae bacterium]
MNWFESLILGLLQGLTEYLPISSSGHLTIASSLFGIEGEQNLAFTILVHVATVLSTLVILWKEIVWIFKDLFAKQQWNSYSNLNYGTKYAINIVASMIPIGIVGVFFKDDIEAIFGAGTTVVGIMLLVTSMLLIFSYYAKPRQKETISIGHAFVIGLAQALAVLPGLSRSGSTIATGILLGNKKENLAQFSFLMVIPPILGEALLDVKDVIESATASGATGQATSVWVLLIGFMAAFLSGCAACKWMISIVRKGKLVYFGIYCALAGILTLIFL